MNSEILSNLLDSIKGIVFFNKHFENHLSKNDFMKLIDVKTSEKAEELLKIKKVINEWLNPVLNNLSEHEEMIEDLMEFANHLFQSKFDDKDVYVDLYFSKNIYEKLLLFFENKNNILNQLICLHWLVRISYSINDYEGGIVFFRKAKKFIYMIDQMSLDEGDYLTRILDNKTQLLSLNPSKDMIPYFRGLLKFYEKHGVYEKFMTLEIANFSKFVLHNNVVDHGISLIRNGSIPEERKINYINYIYDFALKAKEYETLVEGEEIFSNLTPLMLEISYYHGDFKTNKDYYDAIHLSIANLRSSKDAENINDNKDEIEMSLREIYLIDQIDNPDISNSKKIEIMDDMFKLIFKVVSSSRSSYDERYFTKYVKTYVKIASKILSPEDVLRKILGIFRYIDKFTYIHQINVSSIVSILIEKMVYVNPSYFLNSYLVSSLDDVRINKDRIVSYGKHSASFHDIGKLGKLVNIITKLLDLGDSEFQEIKKHVVDGCDIVTSSEETSVYAGPILTHHKTFDFTGGYPVNIPDNVLKNAIETKAYSNIIAIADTIDAITDYIGRAYKDRRYLSDAVSIIRKSSGEEFNPDVVKLLDDEDTLRRIEHIITKTRKDLLYRAFNGEEIVI